VISGSFSDIYFTTLSVCRPRNGDWITSELERILKDAIVVHLRYYLGYGLERLRKSMENFSHDSRES
jgi:hypothetical protein